LDETTIVKCITSMFRDSDVVSAGSGTFFSCDAERHWPNFATLVTTDEYDDASNLSRPGVYRLNIGVSKGTFNSLFAPESKHDFTAMDRLTPYPVYARQHWVSILNPSDARFEAFVNPLLAEAHELVATRFKKRAERR